MPVDAATRRAASPRATPARPAPRPRRAPPRVRTASSTRPRADRRPTTAPDDQRRTRRAPGSASAPSAPAARPRPARRAPPRTIVSWSLVSSRQTAPGRSATARRGQVAQRRRDPARRLVDHRPALVGRDPGEPLAPLAPRARQEALERPARPGHAGRRDRRQHGRRARDRHDPAALGGPRRDQLAARVADGGRPGVGDQREVGAAAQVLEQRRRARRRRSGRGSSSSASRCRGGRAAGGCAACPRPRSAARPAGSRAPAA